MSVFYDQEDLRSLLVKTFVWTLKKGSAYITYALILPKVRDKTLKDNKFTYEIKETFSQ